MITQKYNHLMALRCKIFEERLKDRWKAFSEHVQDNADHYAGVGLFFGYVLIFIGIVALFVAFFRWFLLAFVWMLCVAGAHRFLQELGFFAGSRHG